MPALSLGLLAAGARGPQFDFSAGALPPGATLTRASPGTCVGADGRIATLPAGAARFDHDPVSGRRLGLLVEPAATNLAVYATDFADPAWLLFNDLARVGTVAGVAPDGGAAMRIAFGTLGGADIANASALYQSQPSPTPGEPWCASFWMRAVAQETRARVGLFPGVVPVASSGDLTVIAHRWTRLWVNAVVVASGVNFSVRNDTAGDSADVFVWGAQFELGTTPTSFVATDDAPANRAADVLRLDWGRWGVRDGPVTLRLFFADGKTEDVAATIAGGVATVPPRSRPLVAVRLA